jgi:hypothetical protein
MPTHGNIESVSKHRLRFLVFGFSAVGKHSSCLVLVPLELIVEIIIHILLGLMYKHEIYQRGILLLVTNNF